VSERNEIAAKPVVHKIPGMDAVKIVRDVPFQSANAQLTMDLYRPRDSSAATRLPAVVFVMGYSDLGAEKMFGCKLKEMEAYICWAKLVAASGLIAVTYVNHDPMGDLDALFRHIRENGERLGIDETAIGVWSCSGNVPRALGLMMQDGRPALRCAALCYGCMLDLDGSTNTADGATTWRFTNPTAGKSIRDIPADVPLFIARAGRDNPQLNETLDRFVAHALRANLPITLANHPNGPHAFDILDDSETSREIIRQILAFFRFHLAK